MNDLSDFIKYLKKKSSAVNSLGDCCQQHDDMRYGESAILEDMIDELEAMIND